MKKYNMWKEELLIAPLKSKNSHAKLRRSKDSYTEIEENKNFFKELRNNLSKDQIKK